MSGTAAIDRAIDPGVAAVFDAYPREQRDALLALRRLILRAAADAEVGDVVESLKWGQPAYRPAKARIGTTVRIDAVKGSNELYALYVHCQTTLMDSYKLLYPEAFAFEGDRALIFSTEAAVPETALKHCIALALTYHRGKA